MHEIYIIFQFNLHRYAIVTVLFLCYDLGIKELIFMSLSKYIRTHKELSKLDFLTVYFVIVELLKDGKMEWDSEDV